LVFFDAHVGITKANNLGFTVGTGAHNGLLSAAYITAWAIAGKITGIHNSDGLI
jgi:hypothetical protein